MEANSHASDRNNVMQNHQVAMIGIKAIYQHSLLIGLLNGEAIAGPCLLASPTVFGEVFQSPVERGSNCRTVLGVLRVYVLNSFNPLLNGEAIAGPLPLMVSQLSPLVSIPC